MAEPKRRPAPAQRDGPDARRKVGSATDDEDEKDSGDAGPSVEIDPRQITGRATLLTVVFVSLIGLVILRLVSWELTPAPKPIVPVARADENVRGRIVDSTGLLFATDNFLWEVYLRRSNLEKIHNRPTLLAELGTILGMDQDTLRTEIAAWESDQIIIARNVSDDQCKAIAGLREANAVWCDARRVRAYPQGGLGAHIVGFINMEQEGTGIEGKYDRWLRVSARVPFQQMPGPPEPLPAAWLTYLPSPGGRDLVLNLNGSLQYKAEQRLREGIVKYQATGGTIIIMNPHTGGILALANWPAYDLNHYGDADQGVLRNAAAEFRYEPGSVFKLITYAAALDTGQVTPDTWLKDPGKLEIDGQVIYNAERKAHGTVTATQALAESVNAISARLALDMGGQVFYRYVSLFGFGKPTETDVLLEEPGEVKRWGTDAYNRYNHASNSFGQGISVTPLQMTSAVAAIANGGTLLQPQIAQALVKDGTLYRVPPRFMSQVIKPETARTLTRMMVATVDGYSVKNLVPGFRVAGKTGTAEIPTPGGYNSELTITSFAGFFPAADPQVVILVKLDQPRKSKWAEQVALPVFQIIAQDTVHILKLEPNDAMP